MAIGYADCGTYGALDEVCHDLGLERLPGLHCYDVFAGPERLATFFEEQPGTYLLTDFLVRSFARTVLQELGLDRYPELRDDYFGSYTRVVWLAQEPDDELRGLAEQAAAAIGLPLTVVETGHTGLESALEGLVSQPAPPEPVLPPGLGLGDLVERVDVQTGRQHLRLPDGRRALLDERLPREPAGRDQPGHQALLLGQEAGGVTDPDLGRHAEQLGPVDRSGHAEQQRELDAPEPHTVDPVLDHRGVEGQVADDLGGVLALVPHRLDGQVVVDRRVALRIAGDPDVRGTGCPAR